MRRSIIFIITAALLAAAFSSYAEQADPFADCTWIEEAGVYIKNDANGGYIVDTDGNVLTDGIFWITDDYSEGLFRAMGGTGDDPRWGYVDAAGNVVIPYQFCEAEPFSEGWAAVRIDYLTDSAGYIDHDGQWMNGEEPHFKRTQPFVDGLALVTDSTMDCFFIDKTGAPAWGKKVTWEYAFTFSDGLAMVMKDGKFGYINTDGEFAIEARYKDASPFSHGMAYVYRKKTGPQFIDKEGSVVFDAPGDDALFEYYISDENTIIIDGEFYSRAGDTFVKVDKVGSNFDLADYYPNEGKKVAKLDGKPTLTKIPDKNRPLPRVDGATALFPMYSAFVEAVYPAKTRYSDPWAEKADHMITCSTTTEAYRRLSDGETDIIFVAGPSDAQIEYAAEKGVEFELTPIGHEAFVFIVNKENPMNDISVEQIKGIFSGEITDWSQLGYEGLGEIVPYQRSEGSGSQTALERLMGDTPLMDAPEDYVAWDMGMELAVVEYRNYPNAIGYSFRFYVTGLMQADVKVLSLDGVAPTVENIASGAYPQISDLYAVTRKGDDNPNLAAFLDWVKSEQAAELIEKSGYTPW